jgi:hypothetical protein
MRSCWWLGRCEVVARAVAGVLRIHWWMGQWVLLLAGCSGDAIAAPSDSTAAAAHTIVFSALCSPSTLLPAGPAHEPVSRKLW